MNDQSFKDYLDRLKLAADPRQVAESIGLNRRGKRFFCPACQADGGKTPDLATTDRGFKCFKCGEAGDVINLVMLAKGLDFIDAVDFLANYTGLERPKDKKTASGSTRAKRTRQRPSRDARESSAVNHAEIYDAFLDGCRPVEGLALDYLKSRGFRVEIIEGMSLRFCGREYVDLTNKLTDRFGEDAMLKAGLLAISRKKTPYPAFWPIVAKGVGFLVFPYRQADRAVYLKVRPPVDKKRAEALGVPRMMNVGGEVPCLYNVNAIDRAEKLLICEGETDVLAALSAGYDAVGVPGWSHFKPEWVGMFEGKTVFLALDADEGGKAGVQKIARLFDKAGLPIPKQVILPEGLDLNDFIMEGWNDGKAE